MILKTALAILRVRFLHFHSIPARVSGKNPVSFGSDSELGGGLLQFQVGRSHASIL